MNDFDQFDAQPSSAPIDGSANPFDAFDGSSASDTSKVSASTDNPEDHEIQYDAKTGRPYTNAQRSQAESDFGAGIRNGLKEVVSAPADIANSAITGITRLGGKLYQAAGNDVNPAQAEAFTNPKGVVSGAEAYKDVGAPLEKYDSSLGTLGDLAGNVAGFGALGEVNPALKRLGDIAGGMTRKTGENILTNDASRSIPGTGKIAEDVPPVPLQYDANATHAAISDTYGQMKNKANKYYDFMRSTAEGKPAENLPQLSSHLDQIIDEVAADPFHEARAGVSKIKQLRDKIDDGDFTLPDMVDLKKTLNTYFNPKRFAQDQGDSPYLQLGNTVGNALEKSAAKFPDFGAAKDLADKNWVNTVVNPFENNTVLQKFWKPEDYYAQRSMANGSLEELPDATKLRAMQMLDNVKNSVQLNSIRRALPDDMGKSLLSAKLQEINQGRAASRVKGLAQGLYYGSTPVTPYRIGSALEGIGTAIKGPAYSDLEKGILDLGDKPPPRISDYSPEFDELKNFAKSPRYSLLGEEPTALPAPEKRLALPAPDRPQIVSPEGESRAMTDDEWATHADMQSNPDITTARGAQAEVLPKKVLGTELRQVQAVKDEISAWDRAAKNLTGKGYAYKEIVNKLGKRPKEPELKTGGTVSEPTTAQKIAGNYKKGHMRVQGMNISIENAKGSKRSGVGKDGKKWESKMPHHYGYIRGSAGADGDHVDAYVGEHPHAPHVYLIHQKHLHNGDFDEHKAMIGFPDEKTATNAYHQSFSDGKGKERVMKLEKMAVPKFKKWLKRTVQPKAA